MSGHLMLLGVADLSLWGFAGLEGVVFGTLSVIFYETLEEPITLNKLHIRLVLKSSLQYSPYFELRRSDLAPIPSEDFIVHVFFRHPDLM
jgi:hypothetical protein